MLKELHWVPHHLLINKRLDRLRHKLNDIITDCSLKPNVVKLTLPLTVQLINTEFSSRCDSYNGQFKECQVKNSNGTVAEFNPDNNNCAEGLSLGIKAKI